MSELQLEQRVVSAAKPWSSTMPEPALQQLGPDMVLLLLLHGPGVIPLQTGRARPRLPRLPGMSSLATGVAPMGAHLLALRMHQGELSSPSRIRPPRRRCEETPRAWS